MITLPLVRAIVLHPMLEEHGQVVQEAQQIGNWCFVYWAYDFRSWVHDRLGKYEEATQSMAREQTVAERIGKHTTGLGILEAVSAELVLAAGGWKKRSVMQRRQLSWLGKRWVAYWAKERQSWRGQVLARLWYE
jgi:hypothetical protein